MTVRDQVAEVLLDLSRRGARAPPEDGARVCARRGGPKARRAHLLLKVIAHGDIGLVSCADAHDDTAAHGAVEQRHFADFLELLVLRRLEDLGLLDLLSRARAHTPVRESDRPPPGARLSKLRARTRLSSSSSISGASDSSGISGSSSSRSATPESMSPTGSMLARGDGMPPMGSAPSSGGGVSPLLAGRRTTAARRGHKSRPPPIGVVGRRPAPHGAVRMNHASAAAMSDIAAMSRLM